LSQPDLNLMSSGMAGMAGAGWAAADGAMAADSSGVRAAIARASAATGVDFSYLVAEARLESGFNPGARAAGSSARGLYQFTNGTWLQTLQRHGAALAGDGADLAAALADPAARARLMALRNDPDASALMAASLAADNQQALGSALGRAPDATELYLAHFLGTDGAVKFLSALAADPGQSAASLLPKAAAANRAIFFDESGAPRSLAGMMDLLRGRLAGAMADSSTLAAGSGWALATPAAAAAPVDNSLAGQFAAARADAASLAGTGTGSSMAATLQSTFTAMADATGTPPSATVQAAYGRMAAMGF